MTTINSYAWILSRQQTTDWSAFVTFWDGMYNYSSKSDAYEVYVVKERDASFAFDAVKVRRLFEWKNNTGENMNAKKTGRVNELINQIDEINVLRVAWNDTDFNTTFGTISTVWQTFLMHVIQPDKFPIFDQHVYRAHTYLQTGQVEELKGTIKHQLSLYSGYTSFFNAIRDESGCNPRQIDRALWAFGKFIKQYPALTAETV